MTIQFDQARRAYQQGRYEEAIQRLGDLVARDTQDAQTRLLLGSALQDGGYPEEARVQFQEALRLAKDPKLAETARNALVQLGTRPKTNGQAIQTPRARSPLTPVVPESVLPLQPPAQLAGISLRTKATALAIAIGTLPVLAIGSISYYFANQTITQQVIQEKQGRANDLSDKVDRFMLERYQDIQDMASLDIFRNPQSRAATTLQQKTDRLEQIVANSKGLYNSIAVYDLNGTPLVQTKGPRLDNHKNRDYFQEVLKTDKPAIAQPRNAKSTGVFSLHTAAPIKDLATGKTLFIVRARFTVEFLENVIKNYGADGKDQYALINNTQQAFISKNPALSDQGLLTDLPSLVSTVDQRKPTTMTAVGAKDNQEQLVTYAPIANIPGLPPLNWSTVLLTETSVAYAAQRQLLLNLLLGTGVTALLVGFLAAYLSNRGTRPILAATVAVQKLSQGELETRMAVEGTDELGVLGANINQMADQIQGLLSQQELARTSAEANAEDQRRQRESLQRQLNELLGGVEKLTQGELDSRITVEESGELEELGSNINRMADQIQNLLNQTEVARTSAEQNAQDQRQQKEQLQRQLINLLGEVEGAASGDLTVRANITAGEMGTVADFFNAIIESLRTIVTQVKTATSQVNISLGANEASIRQLSEEALRQADEISLTLDSVEGMTRSIQEVSQSARQAAEVARNASATAEEGGAAMDRTVEGILNLRETVAETAKKVKRLGESSQKISKVVSLINQIALQTNLLAINASIEAARAGEEGRGFAVVAEEVGALAAQSAAATREIEQIVESIQAETSEVVRAMELGTTQVVEGTRLVEDAKRSLEQIRSVSRQIDQLVQSISAATVSQASTSQTVTALMQAVAQVSGRTSDTSRQVSGALQETVQVARQLQQSVEVFKVGAGA
ncbi:methyl-accepting chemotaxis protein [Anthocerotibacter panamensis]|uniref:methyl-accepting chemotaxis protein n=1 Tax=Anthocerotibacter panamensis TaxID=2857077 RepID=UPI001C408BD9|nr:methyl-accepting chemotaxis protein [Anthocerotibacter panamensis]